MTAEQYVRKITGRLQCSGREREEIRLQLLSDMEAELEQGAALEEIMERMGNPADIARDFNQNMPENEKRRYVRKRRLKIAGIILAGLFLAAVLLRWFLPKAETLKDGGRFRRAEVEQQAKKVVQLLDADDMDALQAEATDLMKTYLTPETMNGARSMVAEDWGAFQKYGNIYMTEITQRGETCAAVELTASYENATVTYTMGFDEELKLCALYIK